jgi:hypothetical protein
MSMRNMTVERMALIVGLILGSVMLLIVSVLFLLGRPFGLGGVTLTLIGALMVGLSIWSSVQIRVSPEGGFEASFERFKKEVREEVTSIRSDTKGVVDELTEFKGEIRTSILKTISPETLQKLKQGEKVDRLIQRGELQEALSLDPGNTIALMDLIEKLVKEGQYRQASELYPELVRANESGVGYSVYPQLALAFEKDGHPIEAQKILTELEKAIQTDIEEGEYGYFSRSQQIAWVLGDIQKVATKVRTNAVAVQLRELEANLKATIDVLTKG